MSRTSDRLKLTGAPTDSLQITELTPNQIEGRLLKYVHIIFTLNCFYQSI